MIISLISGFVAAQSAFFSLIRGKPEGLLIAIPAALIAFGAGKLSIKRGERWPARPDHFDVVQLSIDVVAYFLIFYVVIRLTGIS